MSSSGKVALPKAETTLPSARAKQPKKTSKAVPLSCAAEVRNTLPAAFSLVEKVTDPGFHLITASHTACENGDVM